MDKRAAPANTVETQKECSPEIPSRESSTSARLSGCGTEVLAIPATVNFRLNLDILNDPAAHLGNDIQRNQATVRTIAFHREFVTITGTVNAALLLSQILYWSGRTTKPGKWFYKSTPDWMDETGLTRHEIISARRRLVALNIVSEMRRGIPATVNFRLNLDILNELLALRCPKSGQLNVRKADILLAKNRPSNPEMTTEKSLKKERRGHSFGAPVEEIFCPKVRYPESEREMELMLEECGVEYSPDYDGNFFYTMQRNGWCIRGEMIYDWPTTYRARVEHATEPF